MELNKEKIQKFLKFFCTMVFIEIIMFLILKNLLDDIYPLKNSLFVIGMTNLLYAIVTFTGAFNITNIATYHFRSRRYSDDSYYDYNAKKTKERKGNWTNSLITAIIFIVISLIV